MSYERYCLERGNLLAPSTNHTMVWRLLLFISSLPERGELAKLVYHSISAVVGYLGLSTLFCVMLSESEKFSQNVGIPEIVYK